MKSQLKFKVSLTTHTNAYTDHTLALLHVLASIVFDTLNQLLTPFDFYYDRVGGSGMDMRSKARVLDIKTLSGPVNDPSELPKWTYDGSSTGQAPGADSEVLLL